MATNINLASHDTNLPAATVHKSLHTCSVGPTVELFATHFSCTAAANRSDIVNGDFLR